MRLGLTHTRHKETSLWSPFEKYLLEDISLPPAAAVFAPLGSKAVEKAAKENHRRGVILLREDTTRVLAVHTHGVVEENLLLARGRSVPYIQHRALACSVLEHHAVLQRAHRWLLARSMAKRTAVPPEFCNELITGSGTLYSYGLLILGNKASVLLEEGLAEFSTELRHLALVKLVAKIVGERTAGEPVAARLWWRKKDTITDLDYMGKETDAFLAGASP
ncbi:MAG: hypothetical protein QXH27_00885 [Candidatus Micrarchaeia archaeon]